MGQIIWINGLAGAGKTTTAKALVARLKELQKLGELKDDGVIYTDGDEFRAIFKSIGYSKEARIQGSKQRMALSIALAKQGFCVIDAAITLFNECYENNRKMCKEANIKYTEIFIDCPFEVLESRDQKGLYSGAKNGTQKDVVGVDIAYDIPNADVVLNGAGDVKQNIEQIVKYLGL